MRHEVYREIRVSGDFEIFDFVSTGIRGKILKRVAFTETEQDKVYNLALGDVDEDNEANYDVVSDNGDRDRILATVIAIVDAYTLRFPDRWVFFKGTTMGRTRLYRVTIGINFDAFTKLYEIKGYVEGELVIFEKGMDVNGFLIKRKNY